MATVRCKTCGEVYSSTQSKCPCCQTRRSKGGKHLAKKSFDPLPVIIIVVGLLAIAALVYFLFLRPTDDVKKNDDKQSDIPSDISETQGEQNKDTNPDRSSDETPGGNENENTQPSGGDVTIDYIVISTQSVELSSIGETFQLTAYVYPAEAQDMLTWSSEDPGIAAVDESGLVTAVAEGTTKIVATAADQISSCVVKVEFEKKPAILTLSTIYSSNFSGDMTVHVGESVQMYLNVDGQRTNEGVTWSSSSGSASVDENGLVKAISSGQATITASYGEQSVTCICRVP